MEPPTPVLQSCGWIGTRPAPRPVWKIRSYVAVGKRTLAANIGNYKQGLARWNDFWCNWYHLIPVATGYLCEISWNFTCTWVDGCRFVSPIDSTTSFEQPKETFAQIPMACGRLESVQSFMWHLGWSMPQNHLILEVNFEMRGLLYIHKLRKSKPE